MMGSGYLEPVVESETTLPFDTFPYDGNAVHSARNLGDTGEELKVTDDKMLSNTQRMSTSSQPNLNNHKAINKLQKINSLSGN